ncbi:MAG: sigma-70 family RNA polymerase sigma factor [Myxococcota bacterium]
MSPASSREALEAVVRAQAGRVRASLIAAFRDFDQAEDAFQDAVARALERWPEEGVPRDPAAWLLVTARNRSLDRFRHERMRREREEALRFEELRRREEQVEATLPAHEGDTIPDERLRLVFTCCHPALDREAQVALTLHTLGGLPNEAIARAFLVSDAAMKKRLVRARRKIREAAIPYRVPPRAEWSERLAAVLAVVYLVFNQGYTASAADPEERAALCEDALRLARALGDVASEEPEVAGLHALLALHHARRAARHDDAGAFVPLDAQDARRYDEALVAEGRAALERVHALGGGAAYALQAEISATHVEAGLAGWPPERRWREIVRLYDALAERLPSPIVEVNRAVAVGRLEGPEAGLALLDAVAARRAERDRLERYLPYQAARADLLARAGRTGEARRAFDRAIALSAEGPERRYLEKLRAGLTS